MDISIEKLSEIIERASIRGAHEALKLAGVPIQEYFTRADLSKKFGRGKINRMIADGKLTPHRIEESGKKLYKLTQVESFIL